MAYYFIVQRDNKILYEGPDRIEAVSHLPSEASKIHPTSCTYLVEGKFTTEGDFVRIGHIRSAYRSNIIPDLPGGSDAQREIPTGILEKLIDGWRSTRPK